MSSIESSGLLALITKYGWLKLFSLGTAVLGAVLMAAFHPPRTKKEMFMQAAVALGGSLLFGDFFVALVHGWLDLPEAKLIAPVHGLVGALSWGAFGGLAHWRDTKLAKDPIAAIKEAKDVL